jgi:hypothetical protein
MIISTENADLANTLRLQIQDSTECVSDGQGVAMILLWGFFMDHARIEGVDIEGLARNQLESFIDFARDNITLVRQH